MIKVLSVAVLALLSSVATAGDDELAIKVYASGMS
jgi:hypothetical protein